MAGLPGVQRAMGLSWLRPTTAALLALTDDTPDRSTLLDDPAAVLHLLRFSRPTPNPADFAFSPNVLLQAIVCGNAAYLLEHDDSPEIATDSASLPLGRSAARIAAELAGETGSCSPDSAWAAGLLAPLGQYATNVVGHEPSPHEAATIARQLATRWRLPRPFAVTIGFLDLSPDDAEKLGGHAGLHRITQSAIETAKRSEPVSLPPLKTATVDRAMLIRLLRVTAAARQRSGNAVIAELEHQVERLTAIIDHSRSEFDTVLRDAKLTALAEFAAGASHEINNPLAVISGNAQLLLAGEVEADSRKRLEAMIRATNRVHDILIGTRQFARPPQPQPTAIPVAETLSEELAAMQPMAEERGVRIESLRDSEPVTVMADRQQLRHILRAILRNAIEATPQGGWVRASAALVGESVVIAIEDSGPGPDVSQIPHLFDPFFSGRSAGRGRGLGLSQAWRLAKENGGDVAYAPLPGGPTRFTITLPQANSDASTSDQSSRQTA